MASHPPLLDSVRATFLQGPVAINVVACDRDCSPSVTRAYGCRVSDGRVVIFLSVPRSERVLSHLRATGAIAVVFSRPSTHETLQLKGVDAAVEALADGDRAIMHAYARAFVAEVTPISFTESFATALMIGTSEEAVAVSFTPSAAFVQTPGPAAGQRVGA